MYPFKPHFENVLLKRRFSVFISANELNLGQDGAGAKELGLGRGRGRGRKHGAVSQITDLYQFAKLLSEEI